MTGLHEAEDLYHILGVAPNVAPEKIKEQFRFLAHAFHPDKHASPAHKAQAGEMLRKITEAYRVLSDPLQRAAYDHKRAIHVAAFEELGVFQRESARFCLHCGKTFAAPEAAEESAPALIQAQKNYSKLRGVWTCSNCRGIVQPQSSFCIHCGQSFGKPQP